MLSQAGENSQTNDPEHTVVSSYLKDLIFRRNHGRRAVLSEPQCLLFAFKAWRDSWKMARPLFVMFLLARFCFFQQDIK